MARPIDPCRHCTGFSYLDKCQECFVTHANRCLTDIDCPLDHLKQDKPMASSVGRTYGTRAGKD